MPAFYCLQIRLYAEYPVVIDDQRRVLREAWLTRQACTADAAAHAGREQLVVEAIAEVKHLGLLAVRPPAELVAFAADFAQCVDIAHGANHFIQPGAFRGEEAGGLLADA